MVSQITCNELQSILKSRQFLNLEDKCLVFTLYHTIVNFEDKIYGDLKAFADDKTNITDKLKLVLEKVENIVGKRQNAGYQQFLFLPQCFQKASFSRLFKNGIVWERLTTFSNLTSRIILLSDNRLTQE